MNRSQVALLSFMVGGMALTGSAEVNKITEDDVGLAEATVLDFNSAVIGTIASTASLFTDFGIQSLSYLDSLSTYNDGFGVRNNDSRALWANASGLAIVDPGATSLGNGGYEITLQQKNSYFGFAAHDQAGDYIITFYDGEAQVGTITTVLDLVAGSSDGADKMTGYFYSDIQFNRVIVDESGGFAIDDITLGAVPEPASALMLVFGAGLVGLIRRRFVD